MSDTDVTETAGGIEDAAGVAVAATADDLAESDEARSSASETDASDSADDVGDEDEESDSEVDDEDESDEGTPDGASRRSRRAPSVQRLEEEGEVAADYLEELLDITDLDGDIDIDVENGRASVAIVAEGGADRQLRRLVGAKGEVLEALQELARLAVQAATGERSRLMLDVAGFRAARRRALEDVGARACQEVLRTGQPVRLEPMSAFERKVVHDVVAAAGLRSESEGEDPSRRVVVFPASS